MKCLVYSFGLPSGVQFEEALEWYDCQIFLFEPNFVFFSEASHAQAGSEWPVIEDHSYSKNIRFYKMGLYHEDIEKDKNGSKLTTLSSVYERMKPLHGDVVIDFMKIDLEGKEWKVNRTSFFSF